MNSEYNYLIDTTKKFKTIEIFFLISLPSQSINQRSFKLLPSLLYQCCQNFDNVQELENTLETMYGATLLYHTFRINSEETIFFQLTIPNQDFTEKNLVIKAINILENIVFNSKIEFNSYSEEIFNLAKNDLYTEILNIHSNKLLYSISKLSEYMNNQQHRSYTNFIKPNEIKKITRNDINDLYHQIKKDGKFNLCIIGDLDVNYLEKNINKNWNKRNNLNFLNNNEESKINKDKIHIIKEDTNLNQGILTFGLQFFNKVNSEANNVISELIAGGQSSVLYQLLREKNNLTYYINSLVDTNENRIYISTIIDVKDEDKVINIVRNAIKNIKKGEITQKEFLYAKKAIINNLLESLDTPNGNIDKYIQSSKYSTEKNYNFLQKINSLTKNEITTKIQDCEITTIYFLRRGQNENYFIPKL
ncbi:MULTISPECIES: M16 family metallopeptidase [Bacilli]|uniref:M16 family metallopeptidase n=1 Tax=Bacilli TaxID=91061 RepID=UPI0001EF507C|nr:MULTISPECIES: insulinase family protein [Bacilli]EFS18412.1 peptidase M16 inactive domain protein [Staphylococcus hominis subsp. hominis C80]